MTTSRARWIGLHLTPFLTIPLLSHLLHNAIGMNAAAGLALMAVIASIAVGQSRLATNSRMSVSRWMWQTAGAIGLAVAAGLVVMSTVDLAGHDALATYGGMTAAGLTLGAVQAPMVQSGRARWMLMSTAGWLLGALIFRAIIPGLAALSLGQILPYGLVYNAGHNELLWTATGLAIYGLTTAVTSGARASER